MRITNRSARLVAVPVVAVALGCLLAGCGDPSPAAPPAAAVEATAPGPAVPNDAPAAVATRDPNRQRCDRILDVAVVRGLLGGTVEVGGGAARVTGSVTSTRCDWTAANGRYLTVVALDGPGLAARAATVTAAATPVPGRPGVSYDPTRGLIVGVSDRLYQVVAGGAGTAQARVTGLKAVEAIRAGA